MYTLEQTEDFLQNYLHHLIGQACGLFVRKTAQNYSQGKRGV